jgi:hypothetical protein
MQKETSLRNRTVRWLLFVLVWGAIAEIFGNVNPSRDTANVALVMFGIIVVGMTSYLLWLAIVRLAKAVFHEMMAENSRRRSRTGESSVPDLPRTYVPGAWYRVLLMSTATAN